MKAVVFHDIGDIRLDTVPDPTLERADDAIVRITSSAICGTDLHMIRGTLGGMKPGTVLGHEGVGIVEDVGGDVRNLRRGARVVIPSTISCGACSYCRAGYTAQCDAANPHGAQAGTAFYGGPESTGPFNGLQAQYARTSRANASLVALPDDIDDDRAILLSDIFPTGYFGAQLAEVRDGNTVVVYGAGPVGLFAIASARLMGAGRIFSVDHEPSRLDMARALGAETINFSEEDPVEVLLELTRGIGADRVIDAVGVDAQRAPSGDKAEDKAGDHAGDAEEKQQFAQEVEEITQGKAGEGRLWKPGDGPSQVLRWAVKTVAKAGTIGIIGVYPPNDRVFPIGEAMNRNLTVKMGNCNHRTLIPKLVGLVREGGFDPLAILTQREPLTHVLDAYRAFDTRQPGWIKVKLEP